MHITQEFIFHSRPSSIFSVHFSSGRYASFLLLFHVLATWAFLSAGLSRNSVFILDLSLLLAACASSSHSFSLYFLTLGIASQTYWESASLSEGHRIPQLSTFLSNQDIFTGKSASPYRSTRSSNINQYPRGLPPTFVSVTMSNSSFSSTSLLWDHGAGLYTFPSSLSLSGDVVVSIQLCQTLVGSLTSEGFSD